MCTKCNVCDSLEDEEQSTGDGDEEYSQYKNSGMRGSHQASVAVEMVPPGEYLPFPSGGRFAGHLETCVRLLKHREILWESWQSFGNELPSELGLDVLTSVYSQSFDIYSQKYLTI